MPGSLTTLLALLVYLVDFAAYLLVIVPLRSAFLALKNRFTASNTVQASRKTVKQAKNPFASSKASVREQVETCAEQTRPQQGQTECPTKISRHCDVTADVIVACVLSQPTRAGRIRLASCQLLLPPAALARSAASRPCSVAAGDRCGQPAPSRYVTATVLIPPSVTSSCRCPQPVRARRQVRWQVGGVCRTIWSSAAAFRRRTCSTSVVISSTCPTSTSRLCNRHRHLLLPVRPLLQLLNASLTPPTHPGTRLGSYTPSFYSWYQLNWNCRRFCQLSHSSCLHVRPVSCCFCDVECNSRVTDQTRSLRWPWEFQCA